ISYKKRPAHFTSKWKPATTKNVCEYDHLLATTSGGYPECRRYCIRALAVTKQTRRAVYTAIAQFSGNVCAGRPGPAHLSSASHHCAWVAASGCNACSPCCCFHHHLCL